MKIRDLFLLLAAMTACSGDRAPVRAHDELPAGAPLMAEEPELAPPPDRTIDISKVDASQVEGLAFATKSIDPITAAQPKKAETRALAEEEVEAILARLPPIRTEEADETSFAKREGPKPPERAGAAVIAAFPPPSSDAKPEAAAPAPLEVVRMQPQGTVATAGHLSITFSEPMIAAKTDDAIAREKIPVSLSPEPEGQWRWVGTRTLMFEAKQRFPMATEYTVNVPAGVRSANGAELDEPRTFRFSTPPPSVVAFRPTGDSQPLDPLIMISFDQKVDPQAVLQKISVTAGNRRTELMLAPKERVQREVSESFLTDRVVILQAKRPLPKDTPVAVTIGAGTPSAEGPLATKEAVKHTFRTYGPLRYVSHGCDFGSECQPGSTLVVRFNNSIDVGRDQTKLVSIAPRPPDTKIEISWNEVRIRGSFAPLAKYTVTVGAALTDYYGQTLGRAKQATFRMGTVRPFLHAPGDRFVVLDPALLDRPRFPLYSAGHREVRVRLHRVSPEDWFSYLRWLSDSDGSQKVPPPGANVFDRKIALARAEGAISTTEIDLRSALPKGRGNVVLEIEPTDVPPGRSVQKIRRWIQATAIGLDAVIDHEDLYAFVTSLADGRPLPNAAVRIAPAGPEAIADATGFAQLRLLEQGGTSSAILLAQSDDQTAFIPETQWWSERSSWIAKKDPGSHRFFIFDDRGLYRPGETIHFKGWLRRMSGGKGGDVEPLGEYGGPIEWRLRDSRNVELAKGEVKPTSLGGFSFSAVLPKNANLGWARAELRAKDLGDKQGVSGSYAFQIEEFRRPEFEVSASASEGPHLVGQWAELEVSAKYYAGGPLGDAKVRWDLLAEPASYTPPNCDDYSFGIWTPWWRHYDFIDRERAHRSERVSGTTGPDGSHRVRIDLLAANPPRTMTLTGRAAVEDLNRQTWAASTSILVHPSSVYVGLKPVRSFFVLGQKIEMQAIRVDLDGKLAPGRVELTAHPVWGDAIASEPCVRNVETAAPISCEFAATEGGPWRIVATAIDDRGRATRSERVVWVAGGPPRSTMLEQKTIELVPDKDAYAVGDVAELMIRTPFAPAEALVTLRRQGVLRAERISLPQGSAVVRIPIEEAHLPNLNVEIDAVGAEGGKPAWASGSISLRIPPLLRTLAIDLVPEDPIVEPGAKTAVRIAVKDATGRAVEGAEAAVYVVDEAVLALARYRTPDPVPTFYPTRGDGAASLHLRSNIVVAGPPSPEITRRAMRLHELAMEEKMAMSAELAGDAPPAPPPPPGGQIRVRTNFSPLAVFAPEVKTDREGRARIELTMPDNLTRYRVMAVAVAGGKHFGSAESSLTAKKALMVRPSPPRFLNFGDQFELAVIVQNQTNREVPARVVARASNAELESRGVLVRVPPQERALVSFPARTKKPGTARFQIGIAAGAFDDAAELSLPVWTPATTEAFATYGELDLGAIRQPIGIPENVEPSFGALELSTSSTQLQALTDALIYLASYPFGCSEQIASRVLGVAALKDVLAAFAAEGLPPSAEIEAAMLRDVKRLEELQHYSGGWGFWRKDDTPWPFNSIHVMHALIRARDKGFAVPDQVIASGHRYLRSIEGHIPREYPDAARASIEAYALYVRAMMGDVDQNKASALIERSGGVEKLPLEVLGWLYPVLADSSLANELAALRRTIDNRATETAGTAHFATSYEEGGAHLVLHSDRRADALLLEGLIRDQPKSTLIPKLVRGLLAHRTKGRWSNTQENAWVLLALDRYFRTYEKTTPSFVMRAWLGDDFVGEHAFRGRTTERHQVEVPMPYLVALNADRDLFVSKEGEGRLYYRIGLRYAPADRMLAPKNRGFEVERRYEAIDDPNDVTRDADGTWRIRAGARIRVVLTMTATGRRYHVALVDPLPAGFEPLNPTLGMNDAPADDRPWWMWRWYQHQNLRDERAEAFTSLLDGGVHGYAYVARATTVGTFVAPPAYAEEMYAPETFGRSGTDRVVVAPRP